MSTKLTILILDDEPKMGKILSRILQREGHTVSAQTDPEMAVELLGQQEIDLLITDLKMPGKDGIAVMRQAREQNPGLDVVMMTAYASAETAVTAMKAGAFDYLIKPFPNEELIMVVERVAERRALREENQLLRRSLSSQFKPENLVAVSPQMQNLLRRAHKVASTDVSVLLRGESGTGKEVLAQAIHDASAQRDKPMVKVNCGALTETLLESELFGHKRGAFTGAIESRKGLFEQADGSTIFLDEIGEVSPALQVKLLRVLQSGDFQRVGDASSFHSTVRVIAATNRSLEEMMATGQFRSDLYYRLNVVPLLIPPLRERPADIPALIDLFLGRLRKKSDRAIRLSPEAFSLLQSYQWPGNIRELENALEHAFVMCDENLIGPQDLPLALQNIPSCPGQDAAPLPDKLTLDAAERQMLIEAMEATDYNHTRAARRLGITRRALGYRLEKYNLPRHRNHDPNGHPSCQTDTQTTTEET